MDFQLTEEQRMWQESVHDFVAREVLDRVKYTRAGGQPQPSNLAAWFGLDKFLIGTSIVDSSVEGAANSMGYTLG